MSMINVSFKMPKNDYEQLKSTVEKSGASNLSEYLRNALALIAYLDDNGTEGSELILTNVKGDTNLFLRNFSERFAPEARLGVDVKRNTEPVDLPHKRVASG